MNIKRIIKEELEGFKSSSEDDWAWANEIKAGQFQIGGFTYSDGTVIPQELVLIGDMITYPKGSRHTFSIDKILCMGKIYDIDNIHELPTEAGYGYLKIWGSQQPQPYYDDDNKYNWYDADKAVRV